VFLTKIYELRDQRVYMGKPISDDSLTDIVVEGLIDEYDRIKYDAERDPDFSISDIEGVRGRDSAMIETSPLDSSAKPSRLAGKCFFCGGHGHHIRDCRSKRQSNSRSKT
ncbi:unnamed protein product, partial [Sphacelaria rigidula]